MTPQSHSATLLTSINSLSEPTPIFNLLDLSLASVPARNSYKSCPTYPSNLPSPMTNVTKLVPLFQQLHLSLHPVSCPFQLQCTPDLTTFLLIPVGSTVLQNLPPNIHQLTRHHLELAYQFILSSWYSSNINLRWPSRPSLLLHTPLLPLGLSSLWFLHIQKLQHCLHDMFA